MYQVQQILRPRYVFKHIKRLPEGGGDTGREKRGTEMGEMESGVYEKTLLIFLLILKIFLKINSPIPFIVQFKIEYVAAFFLGFICFFSLFGCFEINQLSIIRSRIVVFSKTFLRDDSTTFA